MKKKGKMDKNKLQEKDKNENNIILQKKALRLEENINFGNYSNKKAKKSTINLLSETIKKDKNSKEIKMEDNFSNPDNIKSIKKLTKNSNAIFDIDNAFDVFKSMEDILFLIYTNNFNSIILYNLIDCKIISEIKNAHKKSIGNLKYYLENDSDSDNNRELIMSVSPEDSDIKLWNIINLECIFNYNLFYNDGFLFAACILNDKNINYIITSHFSIDCFPKNIKIYNLNEKYIKPVDNSDNNTVTIIAFHDKKLCKNFIIAGNFGYIKSYDFTKNEIYYKYYDDEYNYSYHNSIVINNNKEMIQMIESSDKGIIRIWDFHSGMLLNKINIYDGKLYGICLWNNNNIFVGNEKGTISLIKLNEEIEIKDINSHKSKVLSIKKFNHPKYGECLLSQSCNCIKLWKIKNK